MSGMSLLSRVAMFSLYHDFLIIEMRFYQYLLFDGRIYTFNGGVTTGIADMPFYVKQIRLFMVKVLSVSFEMGSSFKRMVI